LRFPEKLVTYPEAPGNFRPVIPVVMVIVVIVKPPVNMSLCLRCLQNMCKA
jgi:hypothetical protein